jgi:hypothetical protein
MNDSGIDVFISHDDLIELSSDYKNEYNKMSAYNDKSLFAIEAMEYNPTYNKNGPMFGKYYDIYNSYNHTGISDGSVHYSTRSLYPEEYQPSGTTNMSCIDTYTYTFVLDSTKSQPSVTPNISSIDTYSFSLNPEDYQPA